MFTFDGGLNPYQKYLWQRYCFDQTEYVFSVTDAAIHWTKCPSVFRINRLQLIIGYYAAVLIGRYTSVGRLWGKSGVSLWAVSAVYHRNIV